MTLALLLGLTGLALAVTPISVYLRWRKDRRR